MSGARFTIASLGGIGGRYLTPIIKAPEVATNGVNVGCDFDRKSDEPIEVLTVKMKK